jgi:hypothetical protein
MLLNMTIVLNSEVLGQTLTHSVQNYVISCNVMSSRLFKLLLNNVWKLCVFLSGKRLSSTRQTQIKGSALYEFPRLFGQYFYSCTPHLEAVSSTET